MPFRNWINRARQFAKKRTNQKPSEAERVKKALTEEMLAFSKSMGPKHSGPVRNFAAMVLKRGLNAQRFRKAGIEIKELNEKFVVNAYECALFGYSLAEIKNANCFTKEQIALAETYFRTKRQ